MKASL
jgi:hypothetical protein